MEVRRRVLVTDGGHGGSRDCVAAVRALHAAGYATTVTLSPGTSRASPSRYSERRIPVPHVSEPGYVEAVQDELSRTAYLTTVFASEASMRALGGSGLQLTDKTQLEDAARSVGIESPQSRTFSTWADVMAESASLEYPVVVKPSIRTFSAVRIDEPSQLTDLDVGDGTIVVQQWIDDELHAVSGVMWRGRLVASTSERWMRIWPPHCGLASAAVTTAADPVVEDNLARLLEGYEGIFCAQFAGSLLIDLNLRVHSSHPLSVSAGANLVAIYCDLLNGVSVPRTRAQAGFFYRWLEGDLCHAVNAHRSGAMSLITACRTLLPRRGAAHSIESLRDPMPLLTRLAYALGRVHMSPEQRRQSAVRD